MQLIAQICDTFGIELILSRLFEFPTVSQLAERIEWMLRPNRIAVSNEASISPISRAESLPLSFSQQRMWFLAQLTASSSAYNISTAYRLIGFLDETALQSSFTEIVKRHESLRTTFVEFQGEVHQVISDCIDLSLSRTDLSRIPSEAEKQQALVQMIADAQHPFTLTQSPLFRIHLIRWSEREHILLLNLHHIISDGLSLDIFLKELSILYQAFTLHQPILLPLLPIQYADFAVWQRTRLQGEFLQTHLAYWSQQLKGELPPFYLPTDFPRSQIQTTRGAVQSLAIPEALARAVRTLCQREAVTPFMVLLAVFQVLLYRYTAQEDIAIGTPIAGRNQVEVQDLIGLFVNTLVLRTNLAGNPSFHEFLQRVRQVTVAAYAHQDLPFEKLVEELHPQRIQDQTPLIQVMFQLLNLQMPVPKLPALTVESMEIHTGTTKFDLTVSIFETESSMLAQFEYNTALFRDSTIQRMLAHFHTLLESALTNPTQSIATLPLLTAPEKEQLLTEWNQTHTHYPADRCIHELFEEQAELTPTATAIVFGEETLTYSTLNACANQLAHYLQKRGVKTGERVGLFLKRSPLTIIGMLGILKAGAAYVPLDPDYPPERLEYMLKDARLSRLLTQQSLAANLPAPCTKICLEADWAEIDRENTHNLRHQATPNSQAYVIYTSGSTGIPKGVVVPHCAVNRLVRNTNYIQFNGNDCIAQVSNISFDAATFEIWGALLNGAQLVGISKDVLLSPLAFSTQLYEQNISVLFLTTALFNHLASYRPDAFSRLRYLLFGGEAVDPRWVREILRYPPEQLLHVYGPTENTTFTSWYLVKDVPEAATTIPIGRPISNTQIYLLDQNRQPVPIGVPGELYIGGEGLAQGYLHQDQITQEKFIQNILGPQSGILFKTGDLGRYLPDGHIEFLGRVDRQVKIRGFRIEPGEIETILNQYPVVKTSVVTVQEGEEAEKSLVAYVVPNLDHYSLQHQLQQWQTHYIGQWRSLYQSIYESSQPLQDPTFNITGWNSSYTGVAIPAVEMKEWLDHTIAQILVQKPKRVLEIGCGTGLLLSRIAPRCEQYWGTDFSKEALNYTNKLKKSVRGLKHVKLLQRMADDFSGIEQSSFDTVILNSVVQYLPNLDYFLKVLEGAVKVVKPGGMIYVGDVRSLPLLESYHLSVQLYQVPSSMTQRQFRQRVQQHLAQEEELVISPRFFWALQQHLPQISHVQVQPKRGRFQNELTRFRYDVKLFVGMPKPVITIPSWIDWQKQRITLSDLRQYLITKTPEILGIQNISNARLKQEVQSWRWLGNSPIDATIGQLKENLSTATEGIDPEALYQLSEELSYSIEVSWLNHQRDGCYDTIFQKQNTLAQNSFQSLYTFPIHHSGATAREGYTNNPLQKNINQEVVPQLHLFLRDKLPPYMMPSAFVLMDSLPLTANGKVALSTLPAPIQHNLSLGKSAAVSLTAIEQQLSAIWMEMLGANFSQSNSQIDIYENFFDQGGHSLMAARLLARVQDAFQVELPLRALFQSPTIAGLAECIEKELAKSASTPKTAEQSWAYLIPIWTKGNKQPIFVIPGAHGGEKDLTNLARLFHFLGQDQPIYGLKALGSDGNQRSHSSVEIMAAEYLKEVCHIQRSGPYLLVGECIGGLIAYEMGQQLIAQGQQVALLALLDTWPPSQVSLNDFHRERNLWFRLAHHQKQLLKLKSSQWLPYLSEKIRKCVGLMYPTFDDQVARQHYFAVRYREVLLSYVLKPYLGKITLIASQESCQANIGQSWQPLVTGELEIQKVPGNHDAYLRKYIQITADTLKSCIDKAIISHCE
jgi:amino acid adenylation domain-containing protein